MISFVTEGKANFFLNWKSFIMMPPWLAPVLILYQVVITFHLPNKNSCHYWVHVLCEVTSSWQGDKETKTQR